jgi:hypothetical protein
MDNGGAQFNLFNIIMRDGSIIEAVDFQESMRIIKERPQDWYGVRPIEALRAWERKE